MTFRVIEWIDSLEATAGTFGRSTFHLQRIEEEDEEVNIKFLWSCSTRNIYVFYSCSVYVEQAMSNTEIANNRGIPLDFLYSKDKLNESFLIRFVASELMKTASYAATSKLIKKHILTDGRTYIWLSFW